MANNPDKTLIIIPAYNEASNIEKVVVGIKKEAPSCDILVVNDGSEDSTGQIARKLAVSVIDLPFRLGIGGAMQTGFIYASQNAYDIAVQLDADGQHQPAEIKNLIAPVLAGESDAVIGSRFLASSGFRPDILHRLGCGLLSHLLALLTGCKITDPTSGFRAANKSAVKFYSENYPVDYPEAEAIIHLIKNGFRIKEIPVAMKKRLSGRSSISGIFTIYYMIKVTLAICIASIGHRG